MANWSELHSADWSVGEDRPHGHSEAAWAPREKFVMLDPLPMPEKLEDAYEFTCVICAHSQLAAPSIFMTWGINTGSGDCMNCGLEHHLEIDVDTNAMLATPRREWFEMQRSQ